MSDNELFEMPILGINRRDMKDYPYRAAMIPVSCESRAKYNHGQTLSRLRERGGMGPNEICCLLENLGLWDRTWTKDQTIERLKECGVPRS